MRTINLALALVLIVSNPYIVIAGELDDESNVSNASRRPVDIPSVLIIRENKVDGTYSVAVDKDACKESECDVAQLKTLKFKDVKADQKYIFKGENIELASNELNTDPGADRESWFFGFLFGAAVGAVLFNSYNRRSYYYYRPYASYYYPPYQYSACGYGYRGY